MLIPLNYRSYETIAALERIWSSKIRGWCLPPLHPYAAEYSWGLEMLSRHIVVDHAKALVMDAVGGGGAMQHVMAERFGECWNVDVEPRHVCGGCVLSKLVVADLEDTPGIADETFDGILGVSSVEHNEWSKILSIVRNMLRLLKRGSPLVLTFPAFEVAHYYAQGEWPRPEQARWPRCFCFDVESFREIGRVVSGVASMVEPAMLPSVDEYRATWRQMHDDMMANSPSESRYPYLSAGMVLLKG